MQDFPNRNFENLYVEENDRYIKASENIGENLLTYLQGAFVTLTFNEEEWINVIKDNTNVYEGDALKSNYAYESAGVIVRNNFIQIQSDIIYVIIKNTINNNFTNFQRSLSF